MPCVKLGPGPGAYLLPPETGYRDHDCSKYRNPAFSFGLKTTLINKLKTPGPQYNVDKLTEHGLSGVPAYSMGVVLNPLKRPTVPGPGAYDLDKQHRWPAYSIKDRTTIIDKRCSPGPAAYALPTTIGPKVADKYRFPAYGIAPTVPPIIKFRSPGPAAYAGIDVNIYKSRNPQYTVASPIRPLKPNTVNPGPAGYCPGLVNLKKQPCYSFGVRHGDCAPPYILPNDEC